jgi:hypothetical protein
MPQKLRKTLIDYLVIAISPALIMTLVGSLVFFLIVVFYQGNFPGTLQYIFALFVMAAVLIGRISIEEGKEKAILYAVPLAIVTLLAINSYVQFQGSLPEPFSHFVNIGLIAVVWWSANKLTWDCTLIDDNEEDSGEGLMETVGLERHGKVELQKEIEPAATELEATTSRDERPQSMWQRFVQRRRRPHAPGVWVIYFSLAALPLFGIGQVFLPAGDITVRQYAFSMLAVYTASGLGLLLSTSFLGLRRYLRQRRQEMPFLMINIWLIIGGLLIAAVMAAAILLPRPNPEYSVSELPFRIGSPDQKSSPYAPGGEGVKENQPNARTEKGEGEKSGAAQTDKSDKKSPTPDGQSKDADKSNDEQSKNAGKSEDSEKIQEEKDAKKKSTGGSQADEKKSSDDTSKRQQSGTRGSQGVSQTPSVPRSVPLPNMSGLMNLLKWLFYGVIVVVAIIWFWRNRYEILNALMNFRQMFWEFWNNLFGGKASRTAEEEAEESKKAIEQQRRFADFTDPFAAGTAGGSAPGELVRYTFEALEAWARDHGYPRQADQTPHEFARWLAGHVASLTDTTGRLADLYCQAAYSHGSLSTENVACLSQLWQELKKG